jgi:putative membrane protein
MKIFPLSVLFVIVVQVALGIAPRADRMTWTLENFPVWLMLIALLATRRRFPLSDLAVALLALHSVILAVGGYYTYARVPLGDWVRDAFHLSRNHYDRLGHFVQGFVPAVVVREILIRCARLPRGAWLAALTVACCLAFSACYEFIEWGVALKTGSGATEFLGTQGDPWDTQEDMFLALIGATVSVLVMPRLHDRSMACLPAALITG